MDLGLQKLAKDREGWTRLAAVLGEVKSSQLKTSTRSIDQVNVPGDKPLTYKTKLGAQTEIYSL